MADIGELIAFIKDEVALCGDKGMLLPDLWQTVQGWLTAQKTVRIPLASLDESIPKLPAEYYPPVPLDDHLRGRILNWIEWDSELKTEKIGTPAADDVITGAGAGGSIVAGNDQNIAQQGLRILASETVRWKAITGHNVDYERVPLSLWQLLQIIASCKEEGILQPDLSKASEQDQRSVGPRTNLLDQKGYIRKEPAAKDKCLTSRLTLRRFVRTRDAKLKSGQVVATANKKTKRLRKNQQPAVKDYSLWKDGSIDIAKLQNAILAELKVARNGVLRSSELKTILGLRGPKPEQRFARTTRRLELSGCLHRIRVPKNNMDATPINEANVQDIPKDVEHVKCLKYIRDFKESDWSATRLKAHTIRYGDGREISEAYDAEEAPTKKTQVPLFQRGEVTRQMFGIIDKAGEEGIRGVEAVRKMFGPYFYRPGEQLLQRLTDDPHSSQPAALKRYAIKRETDLHGRTANYRYWTFDNFPKATAELLAADAGNLSKDADKTSKDMFRRAGKGTLVKKAPAWDDKTVDGMGFPVLRRSDFAKGKGAFKDFEAGIKHQYTTDIVAQLDLSGVINEQSIVKWHGQPYGRRTTTSTQSNSSSKFAKTATRYDPTANLKTRGRPKKSDLGNEPSRLSKDQAGPKRKAALHGAEDGQEVDSALQYSSKKTKLALRISEDASSGRQARPHEKHTREHERDNASLSFQWPLPSGISTDLANENSQAAVDPALLMPPPPIPRKRGRPRKQLPPVEADVEGESQAAVDSGLTLPPSPSTRSTRARSSKEISPVEVVVLENGSLNTSDSDFTMTSMPGPDGVVRIPGELKRKRGRPRKDEGSKGAIESPLAKRARTSKTLKNFKLITLEDTFDRFHKVPMQSSINSTWNTRYLSMPKPEALKEILHTVMKLSFEAELTANALSAATFGWFGVAPVQASQNGAWTVTLLPAKRAAINEPTPRLAKRQKLTKATSEPRMPKRKPSPKSKVKSGPKSGSSSREQTDPLPEFSTTHPSPTVSGLRNETTSMAPPRDRSENVDEIQQNEEVPPSEIHASNNQVIDPMLTSAHNPTGRNYTDGFESKASEPFPPIEITPDAEVASLDILEEGGVRLQVDTYVQGRTRIIGGYVQASRQQMMLEIVRASGGAIPMLDLILQFQERTKAKNPASGLPDKKTVLGIANSIVKIGKIKIVSAIYRNSRNLDEAVKIVAENHVRLDSEPLQAAKKLALKESKRMKTSGVVYPHHEIPVEEVGFDSIYAGAPRKKPGPKPGLKRGKSKNSSTKEVGREETRSLLQARGQENTRPRRGRVSVRPAELNQQGQSGQSQPLTEQVPLTSLHEQATPFTPPYGNLNIDPDLGGVASALWIDSVPESPEVPDNSKRNTRSGRSYENKRDNQRPIRDGQITAALALPNGQVATLPPSNRPKEAERLPPSTGVRRKNVHRLRKNRKYDKALLPPAADPALLKSAHQVLREAMERQKRAPIRQYEFQNPATLPSLLAKAPSTLLNAPVEILGTSNIVPSASAQKPSPSKKGGRKPKAAAKDPAMPTATHGEPSMTLNPVQPGVKPKRQYIRRKPVEERTRKGKLIFNVSEDRRMIKAVIIVRTLFGGPTRLIDWDLVATVFPKHTSGEVKFRWRALRETNRHNLRNLQAEFEEKYLEAFEKGDLPHFDRWNTESFPLQQHVDWFRKNVVLLHAKDASDLPGTMEDFHDQYKYTVLSQDWRKDFFLPALSRKARENRMSLHANAYPIYGDQRVVSPEEKKINRVKAALKSMSMMGSTRDAQDIFYNFIEDFEKGTVDVAYHELIKDDKVLSKRVPNKRRPFYSMNLKFNNGFNTAHKDHRFYHEARDYESKIGTLLTSGQSIEISPFLTDGAMAWLVERMAQGAVRIESYGWRLTEMGLIDGYQTRGMSQELFKFKLRLHATPSFKRVNLIPPVYPKPMVSLSTSEIFTWQQLDGNVDEFMWIKAMKSIVSLIMLRPGINAARIAQTLTPFMPLQDVEAMTHWFHANQIVMSFGGALYANTDYWMRLGNLGPPPVIQKRRPSIRNPR